MFSSGKEPACQAGDIRHEFHPSVRRIPWRKAWQPTAVFLSGETQGQGSLVGYGPEGHRELDMTETDLACTHSYLYMHARDLMYCILNPGIEPASLNISSIGRWVLHH